MAVTKIKPIKSTLSKALDYIQNPAKTDEKILVSSFGCSYETADIEFGFTLSQAMEKGNNLAHHLIQSFAPGEVEYEKAHEIGRQLADAVTKGQHEYVLTTHIDKGHIHNHIIFCAVNFVDHHKYKGKMYLSKSLTSSQFRAWSTRRIDNIISFFQNSSDVTLETVSGFNMFSSSSWDDIKQSSIPILNEMALAIIACKKSNIDSYPVSFDLYKAYVELSNKFYEKVYCLCDTCEEPSIPSCPDCGGTHFAITKKAPAKIVCSDCGNAQGGPFVFDCENGHINTIADINDAISLIATDDFTEQLLATIKLYTTESRCSLPYAIIHRCFSISLLLSYHKGNMHGVAFYPIE